MKNTRAMVMLVIALLLGVTAVVLAAQWLGRQSDIATNKVVVAARDIQLGSPLTPDMLNTVAWPAGSLPAGAINDPVARGDRVVKESLTRGEPVLESKLAPRGTKGGLSSVIGEGKRAITVKVNEVIGVAGFALPGNLVDVMVNTKDANQKPISKIVLEKVLVLAVAQEANRDETKPKVVSAVTLELTPAQAERLDLARSVGSLSLVLRNQIDSNPAETTGITKRELLHGAQEPVTVAAAAPPSKPKVAKRAPRRTAAAPGPAAQHGECVEVVSGMTRYTECF